MYTRSLADRLKMKLEILTETFTDFIHRNSLRTPLMVMAGVAVIMTLKNGRQTIDMIKSMNRSPFSSKKASTGFYSPYGRTAGSTSYAPPAYASNSNQFGGASSRQYGTNYASSQMNSQYGQQQGQQPAYGGQMSQSNSAYGMNTGRYNAATPSYGAGNLRGTPATTAGSYPNTAGSYGGSSSTTAGTVSTTSLIAKYGASVQSVQPGLLHDFTSTSSFSGQIETLSAPDAPGFVEQTLRSPGAGKVLVIDGGGTMNALFDSNMAALAQQNGWKGVIINGFVLDPQALAMKQLGVKALGANPTRGMQMMGQRGVPISVAGVMFSPGSWVYADNAGIVVSQQNIGTGGGSTSSRMGGSYPGGGMSGMANNSMSNNGMSNNGMASNGMSNNGMASNGMTNNGMSNNGMANNGMSAGMARPNYGRGGTNAYSTGNSNGGRGYGTTTASQYGRTGNSPYQSKGSSSSLYNSSTGHGRKKPSKRTLLAILIFVCAIIWVLLGE